MFTYKELLSGSTLGKWVADNGTMKSRTRLYLKNNFFACGAILFFFAPSVGRNRQGLRSPPHDVEVNDFTCGFT